MASQRAPSQGLASGVIRTASDGWASAVLWYLAAVAAALAVVVVNGQPLFYFDTFGYLMKGYKTLAVLGFGPPGGGRAVGGGGVEGAARALSDVDGTHSVFYSLILAGFARVRLLSAVPLANAALLFGTLLLLARVLRRNLALTVPLPRLVALPVIVAASTALPFYVAFVMPDIFTPVLILMVALLTVFVTRMTRGEIALALGLGWAAALAHLSHPAIAALLVPVAALGALVVTRRRWWLAPLLVASFVAVPLIEKQAFQVSVETVSQGKAQVSYKPFLTARLIQDGPGYAYLEAHCPDLAIATCPLWDALQLSADPYRLTASHIIFESSDRLGSFLRMSPADQRQVSEAQYVFFFAVLSERPLDTALAILHNTLRQARMTSIEMTLPNPGTQQRMADWSRLFPDNPVALGRLGLDGTWIGPVDWLHATVYAVSALMLLGMILGFGRLPLPLRVLAAMVLAGILCNALVCGGVSQPATRYGARVAWLLPLTAVLLALCRAGLPSLSSPLRRG